ncbi:hypothetical protein HH308_05480 [Gordonia sp. TBRC 11910]|uniref:Uncharacterized protein n=1 Tax=Gordonia asplenii TaxID=2725283 RepID=A0A848KPR7_9ACTN|nr:hypothetical protein [Gordonia asplenii]NMO00666.1 hypothetical protein [Gordonia asplenii]
MSTTSFAATLAGESAGLVWLDYTPYVEQLLDERVRWLDVDAVIAWQRTAMSLIDSDVVGVDATAVLTAWIDAHPDLVEAMSAKRRTTAALRTLFADEALRAHFADLIGSLRTALSGKVIALVTAAPDALVTLAYRGAFGGSSPELDEDDIDSAAVYLADFLRTLSESGLDALVVEEPESGDALTADRVDLYGPIVNVAAHYRWSLGYVTRSAPPQLAASLRPSFWITGVELDDVATGVIVPEGFWADDAPPDPPVRGFLHSRIPPGSGPEKVLDRIAVLRGAVT